jgi:hypothetical protein
MGRGETNTGFWWGNLKERAHLEDHGVDGSSGSGMLGYGPDKAGAGYRQVGDTCEGGNELLGSIKFGEVLA